MPDVRDCDVYMVGSMAVSTDTTEEAMGIASDALGDRLCALPDGEVGPRSVWVAGLGLLTYSRHPDIEEVGEDEGFAPFPGPFGPLGAHRIKGDPAALSLEGYLPYADAALSSYKRYRELKASGRIAPDVRFQVAVPTPHAAVVPFFGDPGQWPAAKAALQTALTADLRRILEHIDATELHVQWDYCTEVVEIVSMATGAVGMGSFLPWHPKVSDEATFAMHTDAAYIRALADGIPDDVRFGYHVCLGTFPAFPTVPVEDMGLIVRIANAIVAATERRLDFLHLPSMPDAGRDFYAPLAELDARGARVFLGIGQRDGAEAIARRGRAAREFLPDFGISHYCGYGRDDREGLVALLADLRTAADVLASDRA